GGVVEPPEGYVDEAKGQQGLGVLRRHAEARPLLPVVYEPEGRCARRDELALLHVELRDRTVERRPYLGIRERALRLGELDLGLADLQSPELVLLCVPPLGTGDGVARLLRRALRLCELGLQSSQLRRRHRADLVELASLFVLPARHLEVRLCGPEGGPRLLHAFAARALGGGQVDRCRVAGDAGVLDL